jgi:hypothetical protein
VSRLFEIQILEVSGRAHQAVIDRKNASSPMMMRANQSFDEGLDHHASV